MKAIQVFEVGFDWMENNSSEAISERLLGTFIEKNGLTAIGNANEFLKTIPIGIVQIQYDGKIYPYIKFNEITIS